MIDNGKYTILYASLEEIEQVLLNPLITFDCIRKNKHTEEETHFYKFRNLTLKFNFRLCEVIVTGSLATFCKGNNYSNVCFSEIEEALKIVSKALLKQPHEILVHWFEFALIVQTPLKPVTYLPYFLSYKGKEFYKQIPPAWSNKPLLTFCSLQQYVIKIYDTAQWHKLTGVNRLKVEIKFNRSAKLLSILKQARPLTMAHLLQVNHLKTWGAYALQIYRDIDKAVNIDPARYRELTNKQRRLLFAGESPKFWPLERKVNRNTYKKDRQEYLRLKRLLMASGNAPMIDLEQRITTTLESLIEG